MASVLGGQAIGWIVRDERKYKMIRVCSYSEFYNKTSNLCEPCLRGNNTKNWLTDNSTGTGPFYSKSINSEVCYDCDDLSSLTSDWKLYLKLEFLCLNKAYFKGYNSTLTVSDYERYDPTAFEKKQIEELEKQERINEEEAGESWSDKLDSIKGKLQELL